MPCLEPWNPFDTSDKVCFPDVSEALSSDLRLEHADVVVDIDVLSRCSPAEIDGFSPPKLGHLHTALTQLLEDKCQAWFDEKRRVKAGRGDSPTPSCSFRLPGIPYIDTAEAVPSTAGSLQANTGNALQPPAPGTTPASVAADASGSLVLQHTSAPQNDAKRQSFAFHSPSRQAAGSPTYPFRSPSKSSAPALHQASAAVGCSPAAVTASLPASSTASSTTATEQRGTAEAGVGSAASRLSWLMQQNLQQLQALLQDQPQACPVTQNQIHHQQEQQQQQALPDQNACRVHAAHNQQQQDAASTQSRLSLLLQQNQTQLQQLLHHRQLQVQQQQQGQPGQNSQGLEHQEQQHNQDIVLQQQASHGQQAQEELPVHPEQRVGSTQSDSRYLPGSPERAAAAAAAAVAAATRARQRVAVVAAAAAHGSSGSSPGHAVADESLRQSGAWSAAAASSPTGTRHAARRHVTFDQAATSAAFAISNLTTSTRFTDIRSGSSSSSATHGLMSSLPPQAVAATSAASTLARLSALQYTGDAAAAHKPHSWRGLQAMQQYRWQQRLQATGSSAAALAAASGTPARSPLKDVETQTVSPPKDQSVQTDMPAAQTQAGGLFDTGGAEAFVEAIAAVGRLYQSSSPAGTTGSQPAMSPLAVAAAAAAAAAVSASAAVASAGSPQRAAATTSIPAAQSPAVMAAAAAAAAAAVAASNGAASHVAVSPPPPPPQQQQQGSKSTGGVGRPAHNVPHSHVVRSLFASSQPTTPVVPAAVPVRHIPISSSQHQESSAQSAGGTPVRARVRPAPAMFGHPQQEQVHTGPIDWQRQQWQQQRPLPWPDPPGVDRPFLSPMKAYKGSSSSRSKSMQREGGLGPPAVATTAGSSARVPLVEATNSPGTTGATSPGLRQSVAASDNQARASTAGAFHAAARSNVSSSVAGVITHAVDPVNMQAGVPTVAAAVPAALFVSSGSPALQRLWSGYKAGFRSAPTSPAAPHSAHGQLATVRVEPTAPGPHERAQFSAMQHTTPTAAAAGTQAEGKSGEDPPAVALLTTGAAAAAGRRRAQQQLSMHAQLPAAGINQGVHHQSPPAAAGPGPAVPPGHTGAVAAVAAVLAASSGPAHIDPSLYPPSVRKLLGDVLLSSRGPPARPGEQQQEAGAVEGVAELVQQQLKVLLGQQLASMALLQRPLVPAVAAAAVGDQQLVGAGQQDSVRDSATASDDDVDGGSGGQLGAEADVDTDSSTAHESASEGTGTHSSNHSRAPASGAGEGRDLDAGSTPDPLAFAQQGVQHDTAIIPMAAHDNVAISSSNRIARLVAAYQQQLVLGSHQQQQHPAVDNAVRATAVKTQGAEARGVSGSSRTSASVRGTPRVPAVGTALESGSSHAAAGQHVSVLPEMMQRFLQE